MNLLLFSSQDYSSGNEITITGRRFKHLKTILKVNVGDSVDVGKIGGLLGKACVTSINEDAVKLEPILNSAPPEKLSLSLIVALPRPKMLARILRNISAAGVSTLHIINCRKVEKSYWQSPLLESKNIEKQFKLGLEQSSDTILPTAMIWHRFKPFVEDHLPGILEGQRAFLMHPGSDQLLPSDYGESTIAVLGPEGGFIPYEVDKLIGVGCIPVSLGKRVQRLECAINWVIGRQISL